MISDLLIDGISHSEEPLTVINTEYPAMAPEIWNQDQLPSPEHEVAEILFITSYPPRECGIATYSQDLIKSLLCCNPNLKRIILKLFS